MPQAKKQDPEAAMAAQVAANKEAERRMRAMQNPPQRPLDASSQPEGVLAGLAGFFKLRKKVLPAAAGK